MQEQQMIGPSHYLQERGTCIHVLAKGENHTDIDERDAAGECIAARQLLISP
jgi:hypothetical protein